MVASYIDGGGTPESKASTVTPVVANIDDEATGTLIISGTVTEGGVLSASLNQLVDADGATTITWRWQISTDGSTGWLDIANATSASYAITADKIQVGQYLRVVATTTDVLGGTTGFSSAAWVVQPTSSRVILGTPNNDTLSGSSGNDIIRAAEGNDLIISDAGNDTIDGGAGLDTMVFAQAWSDVHISRNAGVLTVQAHDGTDTLNGVERLIFSDRKLAFDLGVGDNAAQAVLAVGVLLPSALSSSGIMGAVIGLVDAGYRDSALYQWMQDAGLLQVLAGSNAPQDVARMAAVNVLRITPSTELVDVLAGFMDGRSASYSPAQFLDIVADLDLNQIAVDLVGLQQTGLTFM